MPNGLDEALRQFSPATLSIIEKAEQLARRQNHGFLGVEHLLAVLLQTPLIQQRLQPQILQTLRQIVDSMLQARYTVTPPGNQIHVTYRVDTLLRSLTLTVASRRDHTRVEPEDLLIAILHEGQSLPVLQLQEQGVDVGKLLNALERIAQPRLEIPYELRAWCDDLTARAEQGQLPQIIEGKRERKIIDQIIHVLLSADLGIGPASPVLIGEAGVGKTALVELLAHKITQGEIPQLQNVRIIQVDMNSMLAGTIFRGQFEARLQQTIEFAKTHQKQVVLFIDELHTIVGAGRTIAMTAGADQILLGPLGRGEIRLIGATTIMQYQRHVEQDEALKRRFRAIPVEEPSLEATRETLEGLRPMLEKRSGLRVLPEAVEKALDLSPFYLRSNKLPGKPIQWLKEAIALVACQQREEVRGEDIVTIVSEQTGIPPDIIFRNAQGRLGRMEQVLRERVKGQDHVIAQVARRIRLNLSLLREDLNKPIGVFLFLGPSGVGKTELAKALAEFLFGDEERMVRLDMSEFAGPAMIYSLIDPYGRLISTVRARPYTLILLDEFEKAHSVVQDLFLHVFDEGWLTDGWGSKVYFSDTIIIVTSNLAGEKYRRLQSHLGFRSLREEDLDFEKVRKQIEGDLVKEGLLTPELRNRFDLICVFDPLSLSVLEEICEKLLRDLEKKLSDLGKRLTYDNEVIQHLVQEGYDPLLGARALKREFTQCVCEEIAPLLDQSKVFRLELERKGSQPKLVVYMEREVKQQEPVEE